MLGLMRILLFCLRRGKVVGWWWMRFGNLGLGSFEEMFWDGRAGYGWGGDGDQDCHTVSGSGKGR